VVCLEQGRHVLPGEYPTNSADWELRRQDSFHISPNVRRRPADYPIDDKESPIAIANFNGVGGGTVLYSGHFPRFHPSDFRCRSLDGVGEDWPLDYRALEPYFQENEKMMGVAGLVGDPANPSYIELQPPVPLGAGGLRIAEAFNSLGWHWWPSYSAINTRESGGRGACINLGPCNTGCSQGAKASVDVTYWPEAYRQGARLLTESRVLEITLNAQGKANGVLYQDAAGSMHRFSARVVVVACNGIGTPRLLLNSKSPAFPDGLANESGLVGRNLMLHPLGYVEGVFEEDLQSSIGPQGCCLFSQQFYETDPARGFVRGYTMQILRGAPALETALAGFLKRQINLGPSFHGDFRRLFNHTMGIAVIGEDLPELTNRVELDPERLDTWGMPGAKVYYQLSPNTRRMLAHGIDRSREVIEAAGGKVVASFAPVRNTGWHLMGTARMGLRRRDSVVNEFGQAHDVPNLFIVDSSIFVTGAGVNPVPTAQALTLYICDHIERKLGELFC